MREYRRPRARRTPFLALTALLLGGSAAAQADAAAPPEYPTVVDAESEPMEGDSQDFWDAFRQGHWWLNARYRLEVVDSDAFAKDAVASTLRTALGYETANFYGFRGGIEFENVTVIGNEDMYNSTINGVTDRPVIPDPPGTEVNQAYLGYDGVENTDILVGRTEINLDNQRWVGTVSWRQNYQTFDGVSAEFWGVEDLNVFWSYIDNVNRIFGEDSPLGNARMSSSVLNASYDFEEVGQLVGYWYYFDVDTIQAFSTSTVGARFDGAAPTSLDWDVLYTVEYAKQMDIGNNPFDVDADYFTAVLGGGSPSVKALVGYELLSGSGNAGDALQTPFATLHKFNGWADRFLVTPNTGLEDFYLSLSGNVEQWKWFATYHDFTSDSGGLTYGAEIDAGLTFKVSKELSVGAKYANYNAEDFSTDVQKFWFWITAAI